MKLNKKVISILIVLLIIVLTVIITISIMIATQNKNSDVVKANANASTVTIGSGSYVTDSDHNAEIQNFGTFSLKASAQSATLWYENKASDTINLSYTPAKKCSYMAIAVSTNSQYIFHSLSGSGENISLPTSFSVMRQGKANANENITISDTVSSPASGGTGYLYLLTDE